MGTQGLVASYSAGSSIMPGQYAIQFDNTKFHHISLAAFYKAGVVYNDCYYEFVVKPTNGCEYFYSAGSGGAHMMLCGFNAADGAIASRVSGNVVNALGTLTDVNFTSDDYLYQDHWHHFSVGYDSSFVTVYVHGIPSYQIAKTTGRLALTPGGDGVGYIGGSSHSNANGKFARATIYENLHPFTADNTNGTIIPVRPSARPATYLSDTTFASPDLNIDVRTGTLIDSSKGFEGQQHHGIFDIGGDSGATFLLDYSSAWPASDLPQWVNDPVALNDTSPLTPVALPAGAKGGDNFIKGDRTGFWYNDADINLGTSQAGTLPAQDWATTSQGIYGVIAGRAYLQGGYSNTGHPTTLTGDSVTQKAELSVSGFKTNGPELYINYTDANNHFRINYYYAGGFHQLTAKKTIGGVESDAGSTQITAGGGTYTAPYTLTVERTAGNHYLCSYNGVQWIDYDDSANPHLTGTKVGFDINTNHFARVDSLIFY